MRTWLKGGLIGGGIWFILELISYSLFQTHSLPIVSISVLISIIALFPWSILPLTRISNLFVTLIYPLGLITYFIIGAIIGLIITKLKNKK